MRFCDLHRFSYLADVLTVRQGQLVEETLNFYVIHRVVIFSMVRIWGASLVEETLKFYVIWALLPAHRPSTINMFNLCVRIRGLVLLI